MATRKVDKHNMSNNKQNLGTIGIVNHKIENVEYVF